jgi:hypothetical protein
MSGTVHRTEFESRAKRLGSAVHSLAGDLVEERPQGRRATPRALEAADQLAIERDIHDGIEQRLTAGAPARRCRSSRPAPGRARSPASSSPATMSSSSDGMRIVGRVPDDVRLKLEFEIGADETKSEIELTRATRGGSPRCPSSMTRCRLLAVAALVLLGLSLGGSGRDRR